MRAVSVEPLRYKGLALYAVVPVQAPYCMPGHNYTLGLALVIYDVPEDRRKAVHGFQYVISVAGDKASSRTGFAGSEGLRLYVHLRRALWQRLGLPEPTSKAKVVCQWQVEEKRWHEIEEHDAAVRQRHEMDFGVAAASQMPVHDRPEPLVQEVAAGQQPDA
jgi:hypothetical protein